MYPCIHSFHQWAHATLRQTFKGFQTIVFVMLVRLLFWLAWPTCNWDGLGPEQQQAGHMWSSKWIMYWISLCALKRNIFPSLFSCSHFPSISYLASSNKKKKTVHEMILPCLLVLVKTFFNICCHLENTVKTRV